jgi:leader peptidase (prepilin peptidase) / N-methyltransferase
MFVGTWGWLGPATAWMMGLGLGVVAAGVVERRPGGALTVPTRRGPTRFTGPLVAGTCATVAAVVVALLGVTWAALATAALAVALVPVVILDVRHRLIPDLIVVPATAVALPASILADPVAWWRPLACSLGAGGFMFVLWALHPAGMGLGDVKLAALMGAALGPAVIAALAVAFGTGALLGAALLALVGGRARTVAVPFAPFLAAGAVVALWAGAPLVGWYLAALG